MNGAELKVILSATALLVVLVVLGLVSAHEKHYSRRALLLLSSRVDALEKAFLEDRTL